MPRARCAALREAAARSVPSRAELRARLADFQGRRIRGRSSESRCCPLAASLCPQLDFGLRISSGTQFPKPEGCCPARSLPRRVRVGSPGGRGARTRTSLPRAGGGSRRGLQLPELGYTPRRAFAQGAFPQPDSCSRIIHGLSIERRHVSAPGCVRAC